MYLTIIISVKEYNETIFDSRQPVALNHPAADENGISHIVVRNVYHIGQFMQRPDAGQSPYTHTHIRLTALFPRLPG